MRFLCIISIYYIFKVHRTYKRNTLYIHPKYFGASYDELRINYSMKSECFENVVKKSFSASFLRKIVSKAKSPCLYSHYVIP